MSMIVLSRSPVHPDSTRARGKAAGSIQGAPQPSAEIRQGAILPHLFIFFSTGSRLSKGDEATSRGDRDLQVQLS